MASVRGTVKIDVETCKGCELCIESCPQESLAMSSRFNKQGYHFAVLVQDNCTGCVNCALVCPEAVITVYRTGKKKKEKLATISEVHGDITLTVDEKTVEVSAS